MLEAVLHRTEAGARRRDVLDRGVDLVERQSAQGRARGAGGRQGDDVVGANASAGARQVEARRRDGLAGGRADLEGHAAVVEQRGAVELRLRGDVLDLGAERGDLGEDRVAVVQAQGAVLELHTQVADTLQHRGDLVEGTLSRLDERDAVLGVALRLIDAADLRTHLLADREAGRVIGGTVDAVAGGKLLHRLGSVRRDRHQVAMRVERLDVVLNTKAHDQLSLLKWVWGFSKRLPVASVGMIGPAAETLRKVFSAADVEAAGPLRRRVLRTRGNGAAAPFAGLLAGAALGLALDRVQWTQ